MATRSVPPWRSGQAFTDEKGQLTGNARDWLNHLRDRTGGDADKVDAAHTLARNAVPQSTQVVTGGGLKLGGALDRNVGVTLYVASDLAANLPTTGLSEGDWAYATDGRKSGEAAGAGTGVPCWWSGAGWYAVNSGAVVSV